MQLSLFDERDLAEFTHPTYLGERLVACRNPLLTVERTRTCAELLDAGEAALAPIVAAEPLFNVQRHRGSFYSELKTTT